LLSAFVPVTIYNNAETARSEILADNKGRAGIYLWTHKQSGKRYVGSAFDLSKRLSKYYSKAYLESIKTSYICNALKSHLHSAFSLAIVEHVDIPNLSKEEARDLILSREQFYLDELQPEYNILKVAGSSLGYKHAPESLAKFTGENHPRGMLGKTHSPDALAKMSEALSGENNPMFGVTGENHPMFGKSHSTETKQKISEALKGENHPMFGVTGENHPMFGISHSEETKHKMSQAHSGENHPMFGKSHSAESLEKMSKSQRSIDRTGENNPMFGITGENHPMSKKVFIYEFYSKTKDTIFYKELSSCAEAATYFDCTTRSISNYLDKNKLYKKQWILSSSLITKKE
jgi:group I intron endonuclease